MIWIKCHWQSPQPALLEFRFFLYKRFFSVVVLFLLVKILYKDWVNIFVVCKFSNKGWPVACDDDWRHCTVEMILLNYKHQYHCKHFCRGKSYGRVSMPGLVSMAGLGCIKISISQDKHNSGWDWSYQSSREPRYPSNYCQH